MSLQLNYKLQGDGPTIVLLHGLFGNLDNLGLLARDFVLDHQVLSVDLRNHGLSVQSEDHSYSLLASDVIQLIQHLGIESCALVGHSMGGKVAMKVASEIQTAISQLIVLDMAPVAYSDHRHDNVFSGLTAVLDAKPASRREAQDILAKHVEIEGVRQFLGKSLYKEGNAFMWRFNVPSLIKNYDKIIGWEYLNPVSCPTLFIKGAKSDYITEAHQTHVQSQFTNVKAHVISNTGHWLHAEKPLDVIRVIRRFLSQ